MAVRAPGIRLDIERIVIDGLALADRRRFERAFTDECSAGLADAQYENAAARNGRIDIALARDAGPEAIGRALARGIIRLVRRP
jgi:hypothetical protein